jgi:broad specificity phosphatase PhoE
VPRRRKRSKLDLGVGPISLYHFKSWGVVQGFGALGGEMQIVFARHGESYANVNRIISNRGLQYGLTSKGREQAVALARKLKGQGISRAFSSSILRAIETTILAARELGVDYQVVDALREVDCGALEGRSDDGAWEELQSLYQAWAVQGDHERRIEGGEGVTDVRGRFLPFLESLISRYGDTDERILCVAHGGLYWMMLPHVLDNVSLEQMVDLGMDYTSCVVSEYRSGRLLGLEWNGAPLALDAASGGNASS